jgi:RNA polymerase sigma factor (sigma-70 family)
MASVVINRSWLINLTGLKTDEELISGCLKGSEACHTALYHRYSSRLYAVCLRYARNKSDAPDILQDGFVKIFKSLSQYTGNGSFEGWMRRVMVNTALRHYQRQRYQFEHNGYEVMPESSIDATVIDGLSAEDLMIIIDKLPPGYKDVFNLVAIDGFSHKEAADLLEIGESSSRSQLTKARIYLCNLLETTEYAQFAKKNKIISISRNTPPNQLKLSEG